MFRALMIACLLFAAVVIPATGMEVTRTVEPGNDGTCNVYLKMDSLTTTGITENIPKGSAVASCSLPAYQWEQSGDHLFLAVIDEDEITYVIPNCRPEELSGTWIDLSDGTGGTVSGADETAQTTYPAHDVSATTPLPTKAGTGPVAIGVSLATLGLAAFAVRRKER